MNTWNIKWNLLIKSLLLPLLTGGLAGLLTSPAMKTYQTMNQPLLAPPAVLFPVVWTILYLLMGISSYLIQTAVVPSDEKEAAGLLNYIQLFVNFLWPVFFFSFGWYLFALFWLILLWILVFQMIRRYYTISKLAAYLNIPYLIWLTFAAYLNYAVWVLN